MRKDGIDDVYQFIKKLQKKKCPLDSAEQQLKQFYNSNDYDRGVTLYNSLNEDYRPWGKINMSWPNADSFGPTYEVLHPLTNNPVKIPDRGWRWKEDTFNNIAEIKNGKYTNIKKLYDGSVVCGRIWFARNEKTQPSSIKFLDEVEDFLLRSIISTKSEGGFEVEKLFGGKGYFSYPKPINLIKTLFGSVTTEDENIYLDFFAGSGTTAHSILELNIEDNKKRHFICVQLDEKTDEKKQAYKEGYNNIFSVTKDRITKAAQKLKEEHPEYHGDLAFKIFETVNDFRVKDKTELTLSNYSFFDNVILTQEQYNTLLTTWCVYDGSLLTASIQDVDLNGYTAHLCDGHLYLIAPNFTSESLKALLQKLDSDKNFSPNKVVFYGNNFESAKQMELNEALKSYANKKSIELDLVVRN